MLRALHIAGLGVIDDLDLSFHEGLNVLTGETGAGKTMITVGLALALGSRGSTMLVRDGATSARVEALFEVATTTAVEAPFEGWVDDGELVLARSVPAEGKGSARISGQLATVSALAGLGAALVEVHGQHHAQRLLDPSVQTAFLDRYVGDAHLVALAAYREAFEELRASASALDELRAASRDRERELDLLAYQVREIEAVGPEAGETERLTAEEARLAHVERLLEAGSVAEAALADDEGAGATSGLGIAARALDAAADLDPGVSGLAERAVSLAAEAAELARDVRAYRESLAADPARLQIVRERIAAVRGLQRKYGETDADVLAYLAQASAGVAALETADDRLAELEASAAALRDRVTERAAVVSAGRLGGAGELGAAIGAELEELGMPGAVVSVALEAAAELGPRGAERVELRLSAGAGAPPTRLSDAASGGELSRTMLACRSVLADLDAVPTLVFDEVDAGIGGRAGLAVGRRLARLARDRQVIVVTHLPQIACFADRHVRVTKQGSTAAVEVLDDEGKVRELSRMLAGLDESEGAVSHAQELLEEAERVRAGA